MKLIEAAQEREKGQILKWKHYFETYDFHFDPFRGKPITLLEIGVMGGGSLWMWKKYFQDSGSLIVGIDCDPRCKQWKGENIHICTGDQADTLFLLTVADQYGPFDIIIDDGGHKIKEQIVSFDTLFPFVTDGGIYVIEDLHTSYWPAWGGKPHGNTTIEKLKSEIDRLHGWAIESKEAENYRVQNVPKVPTSSLHFYDSICFIYKNGHGKNEDGEGGVWHG